MISESEVILSEIQYFPPIAFWINALKATHIRLEAYENYQKRSFRNRTVLATSQGIFWMSLPLKGGKNNQMPITKVEIDFDQNWQKNHWETIRSAYGNAPFFPYYQEEIQNMVFLNEKFLYEFNFKIIQQLISLCQLDINLSRSTEFELEPTALDRRNFISIKKYHKYKLPYYQQVFTDKIGFATNLSILDLLFCKGPEVESYLRSCKLDE